MDRCLVSDVPRSGALVRVLCGVRLEELGVGPAVLDWGHCLLLDVPKLEPETKLISPPSPKLHTHTHM